MKNCATRPHRFKFFNFGYSCYRNILEFESYNVDDIREVSHFVEVVVLSWEPLVGNLTVWRIIFGGERVNPITHFPCGNSEHPAELTATKYSNNTSRQNWPIHVSNCR